MRFGILYANIQTIMFIYHWLDIMNYWFRYHSFFCSGRLSRSLNSLTLCRFIVFDFLTEVLFLLFGSKFCGLLSRSKFTLYPFVNE